MAESISTSLLPAGKVAPDLLSTLLQQLPTHHERLLLGPGLGEDAAVIDFAPGSEMVLVAKSDPITFATDAIGHYAVHVCANDLAVTGATPLFYLPTLLLPAQQTTAQTAGQLFAQIGHVCRQLAITVVGGHTEITPTVSQPIVAGTLLGQARRDQVVHTGGAQPGDLVLMAGGAPIEGASLIAREMAADLLARGWDRAELAEAANYLYTPGISVLPPALYAAQTGLVTAMHDPTEGGIATGLWEVAQASRVGMEIDLTQISVPNLARRLCAVYDLDPLGTIASGSLLATAPTQNVSRLLAGWQKLGWSGMVIGRVVDRRLNGEVWSSGAQGDFPRFVVDEITRL